MKGRRDYTSQLRNIHGSKSSTALPFQSPLTLSIHEQEQAFVLTQESTNILVLCYGMLRV